MKTMLLLTTLAIATSAHAGGLSTPEARPQQFTDEELTAINAIPFGKSKPTVQQIVAHAKKAMVWITVLDQDRRPVMHGTGFFIDDGAGVLTNYHVVERGKYFEAEIIDSGRKMLDGSVSDRIDCVISRCCAFPLIKMVGKTLPTRICSLNSFFC
jgi:S1-C subfamily serine protease